MIYCWCGFLTSYLDLIFRYSLIYLFDLMDWEAILTIKSHPNQIIGCYSFVVVYFSSFGIMYIKTHRLLVLESNCVLVVCGWSAGLCFVLLVLFLSFFYLLLLFALFSRYSVLLHFYINVVASVNFYFSFPNLTTSTDIKYFFVLYL